MKRLQLPSSLFAPEESFFNLPPRKMITHAQNIADFKLFLSRPSSLPHARPRIQLSDHPLPASRHTKPLCAGLREDPAAGDAESQAEPRRILTGNRREFLLLPSLAAATGVLLSIPAARADEGASDPPAATTGEEKKEEVAISSRVYDATVIGEPQAVGKDKSKVWEKLMSARVVYLGEAEQVPDRDDTVLELEIVKTLRNRFIEQQRTISVALEAFPCTLQEQLNQFMDGRFALLHRPFLLTLTLK